MTQATLSPPRVATATLSPTATPTATAAPTFDCAEQEMWGSIALDQGRVESMRRSLQDKGVRVKEIRGEMYGEYHGCSFHAMHPDYHLLIAVESVANQSELEAFGRSIEDFIAQQPSGMNLGNTARLQFVDPAGRSVCTLLPGGLHCAMVPSPTP